MAGQYQVRYEYFKQYQEKNKERLQQQRKDYYEQNKDKIKENVREYKADPLNKMMSKVTRQEYCEKNKDIINAKRRAKHAEKKQQKWQPHKAYQAGRQRTRDSIRCVAYMFV